MPALHGINQTLKAYLGGTADDPVIFVVSYDDEQETSETIVKKNHRTGPVSVNGTSPITLLGPAPSNHTYVIKEIQLVQPNWEDTRVTCSIFDGGTEGKLFDLDLDERDHVWCS